MDNFINKIILIFENINYIYKDNCDAPKAWGLYFQDSASPQMEALVELHNNIMFYLVIILFGVGWILLTIVRNYVNTKSPISNKYLNHGKNVPIQKYFKFSKNSIALRNYSTFINISSDNNNLNNENTNISVKTYEDIYFMKILVWSFILQSWYPSAWYQCSWREILFP